MSTVGKVLLVAATGIVLSKNLSNKRESLKGMSYITVYIMLPCLLFTEMTKVVSWSSLSQYYSAVLLSLVPMLTGYVISRSLRRLVPHELHGLLILACTFQNALSFGLGILMSLHGVPWFTSDRVAEAEGYVFLYNVCCSLSLWSFAMHIVKTCKAVADAAEAARLRGADDGGSGSVQRIVTGAGKKSAVGVTPTSPIKKTCFPPEAIVVEDISKTNASRSLTVSNTSCLSLRCSSNGVRQSQQQQLSFTTVAVADGAPDDGVADRRVEEGDDDRSSLTHAGSLSPQGGDLEATKELELATRELDQGEEKVLDEACSAIEASGLHSDRGIEMLPYSGTAAANGLVAESGGDDDTCGTHLRESWTNVSPSSTQQNMRDIGPHRVDAGASQSPAAGDNKIVRLDSDDNAPSLIPARAKRVFTRAASAYDSHVKPLLSTTILASFIGIFVALFPPLRLVAESNLGQIFIGGLSMLGEGTVPMTLLILGCNLMSDEAAGSTAGMAAIPRRFVLVVVAVRLVLIPALFLMLMHVLFVVGVVPENRVFRLTVLVESCAPTAINASVICSFFSYRTKEFSRVLFIVYVASIASTTGWLMVYLWYLGE